MPILGNFPAGGGGGGTGGLALAAVTNIATVTAHEKVYVSWTDPDDLVVAGSTLAAWGGTLLVRKAGSAPVSRRDGTVVLDSKTRNQYSTTYFCDSGLTDGVTYYYKFFPYTTSSTYTDSTDDEFTATPAAVAPGNVSGMSAVAAGNGKITVQWGDPAATIVTDGITVSTWASTQVVYKTGSYPTDPSDGTLALNSTTRNQYATNGFTITGLMNGTTYYIAFFPTSTDGAVNTDTVNRVTGVPNRLVINDIPAQSGTLTYNKAPQNPVWDSAYDPTIMTLGGETVGTNAKTYVATFTPDDDHVFAGDASPKAKNVSWVIGKAAGTLTLTPASLVLDKTTTSATFAISGDFDGSYTVTSMDTSVATVALVSGKTYRVSSVNSTTGTTSIKVSCSGGSNYTAPADKSVSVTAKFVTIYGASWDGSSTTKWSRTDAAASFTDPVPAVNNGSGSSPFDTLQPWAGMVKDTSDSAAGVLVKIPKFWYKWTKSGNTLKLQIADGQVDGFNVSPAHANRGDGKGERDFVYVGRYHCASGYKSTTGAAQQVSITRSTARSGIHNLGATIWQFDYAMRVTIQMLYLVEFADWNSQAKIGYGCSASGSKENNGKTDAMQYHTGTTAANRTTYGYTQYRNIEGLWDNVYDWMDGCYYNGSGMNIIMNPANFSDSSGGTLIGKPSSGYPSAIAVATASGLEWAIYPTAASGSDSTYVADYWNYSASNPCLRCGGSYGHYQDHGLFCVYGNYASSASASIGCRLQKLP